MTAGTDADPLTAARKGQIAPLLADAARDGGFAEALLITFGWIDIPPDDQVGLLIRRLEELAQEPGSTRPQLMAAAEDLCDVLFIRRPSVNAVPAPRRSSRWLLGCAVRVLPAVERARYREEFEAELVELATRRRQLRHAVRLVVGAVPLRFELRRSARERVR